MTAQIIALPARQADAVAFRTPGSPPPRDPPVWLPAVAPVKRPKPGKGRNTERELADRLKAVCDGIGATVRFSSPKLTRGKFLTQAALLHRIAGDLDMAITVHPQGGAS